MAAADSGEGGGGVEKTVTLVSSDGARFEVREEAASLSQTVRRMIDEAAGGKAGGDGGIPLPDVDARILSKVLEYCHKHARAPAPAPAPVLAVDPESSSAEATAAAADAEDLEWFDKEFMHVGMDTLYHLILAAAYLKVEGLLDLACKTVADMIKGKTPEQIRQLFGIENDLTPEEEEAIRRENAWIFERLR